MMKNSVSATDATGYLSALDGWRGDCVVALRRSILTSPELNEGIKWGHLVYTFEGPVLLIRAEEERVLFGFWRGWFLRDIEPRLKPGGKYDMATLELRQGDRIAPQVVEALVKHAVELNRQKGNPTLLAKRQA
jgi:hypothetical protein